MEWPAKSGQAPTFGKTRPSYYKRRPGPAAARDMTNRVAGKIWKHGIQENVAFPVTYYYAALENPNRIEISPKIKIRAQNSKISYISIRENSEKHLF